MARNSRKRSDKAWLPPGTLMHIGRKREGQVAVQIIDYDEERCLEKTVTAIDECLAYRDQPGKTWINIKGVHDIALLEKLGTCFGIHHLILEDILNTEQRPKMDDMEQYVYLVFRMLDLDRASDEIVSEQVSLILGERYVISFQEGVIGGLFQPLLERMRNAHGRIRKMGVDYLLYAMLDGVVDNYFVLLERIGERIELLEEELVSNPSKKTLPKIHKLKWELIQLRRSIWPLRDVIYRLAGRESALIRPETQIYLRDVSDHIIQVIDAIETYREMATGILDIYLSSINNRMNEVMKVLTIITTIFIPLTLIAGIYGMNFRFMPELNWRWSYPLVLGAMLLAVVFMLIIFKKKKWL